MFSSAVPVIRRQLNYILQILSPFPALEASVESHAVFFSYCVGMRPALRATPEV
jgi:hypothetical protein